jgi:hypothetical protein
VRIRLAILAALLVAALSIVADAESGSLRSDATACKAGYYENSSHRCVHRPVRASAAPKGATARCRDGTYSFSQHASGTCSHHGGVAVWIHHP